MNKTFVGFGFGPIQSGLFLHEARRSGNFARTVVAEVDPAIVAAVRANDGRYAINVAHADGIEQVTLEGVELCNPAVPEDRARLLDAIAESDEMATALPAVRFYDADPQTSVARLVAEGLGRRATPRATILYAAENNNDAAAIFTERLAQHAPAPTMARFQTLDTVIGKMSGVITDADTIRELGLVTATPTLPRAVLVEEFNRILVSAVTLDGARRGITVFREKPDLLPFEEAKLYGHNAIHATLGWLAELRGLRTIADAAPHADLMAIARDAFLDESGAALVRRHAALGDPLFTPGGYRDYADDLLARMVNPWLNDLVERVTRDHVRKLGLNDRLFGTMRLALEQGIEPRNLALGAAAALVSLTRRRHEDPRAAQLPLPTDADGLDREAIARLLTAIWNAPAASPEHGCLIQLTARALDDLGTRGWI